MSERFLSACLVVSLVVLSGCSKPEPEFHGKRAGVRGAVTLDGKPLENATITFAPATGEKKVVASSPIRKGFYEIPAEAGPLVGKMRVEIASDEKELEHFERDRGRNPKKIVSHILVHIPAKYNSKSKLTADVTEDDAQNKFDFRLVTK